MKTAGFILLGLAALDVVMLMLLLGTVWFAHRSVRKEAAAKVGVDEAQLSRWIAGDSRNRPQFDRLFAVPELRQPLVIGLSALADGAEVVTEIRFRRRA